MTFDKKSAQDQKIEEYKWLIKAREKVQRA